MLAAMLLAYQADRSAYWIPWTGGAAIAALLAWIQPDLRLLLLPLSGIEAVVALTLALIRQRRPAR
ncbi:hypothetical protein ACFQ2M_19595 [Kitasatospora saccharophila]|uniref:hypothetical protein n=1 Tax=Kitasatospora saccharophila TaxID=407973 RepID=UPI003626BC44